MTTELAHPEYLLTTNELESQRNDAAVVGLDPGQGNILQLPKALKHDCIPFV